MSTETTGTRRHGNAYNIFILTLTVLSLVLMVWMLLPVSDATMALLQIYDNLICAIFLIDFFLNLSAAKPRSEYFIKERGWLDLLGSIPSFGLAFRYSGLFRLARLSRFSRITRLLRGKNKEALVKDLLQNRGQYTVFITILMSLLVLSIGGALVLQFESVSPEANIKSGGDALWYSLVTITTVGYGDRYPVTLWGRVSAFFIMLMGVGIIGALASILSSLLVGGSSPSPQAEKAPAAAASLPAGQELDQENPEGPASEIAAIRQLLEAQEKTSADLKEKLERLEKRLAAQSR